MACFAFKTLLHCAHNFPLSSALNFSNPPLSAVPMPSRAGLPVSLSTKTCTTLPTALIPSTPSSQIPTSYVTLVLPSLWTRSLVSATAGKAIEER